MHDVPEPWIAFLVRKKTMAHVNYCPARVTFLPVSVLFARAAVKECDGKRLLFYRRFFSYDVLSRQVIQSMYLRDTKQIDTSA